MGILSALGALGKIAGAFKAVMRWFSDRRLIEAGQDKERAEISEQETQNDTEIRGTRNSVRTGGDADRVFDNFLKNDREK